MGYFLKWKSCTTCDGDGYTAEVENNGCIRCNGSGVVSGLFFGERICPTCEGSGYGCDPKSVKDCGYCKGKGYTYEKEYELDD